MAFLTEDETIYCELVQWCDNCENQACVLLAQYLGAINDVLFPPNMCSTDGVDLLMRRTTDFPVSSAANTYIVGKKNYFKANKIYG